MNEVTDKKNLTADTMPIVLKAKNDVMGIGLLIEKAIELGRPVMELVELQKEAMQIRAVQNFNIGRQMFTSELTPCPKTKTATMPGKGDRNGWSYQFAPLEAIEEHIKPICLKFGFSYSFTMRPPVDGWIVTICTLYHIDGHSIEGEFWAPVGNNAAISGMQNVAATNSFCKRQALSAILGMSFSEGMDNENALPRQTLAQAEDGQQRSNVTEMKPRPDSPASEKQIGLIKFRISKSSVDEERLCHEFKVDCLESILRTQVDGVLAWIDGMTG
jgi:hypothetical protein